MPESNVYLGDCEDFMKDVPDKFYQLAIVDPPYGIGLGFSDSHQQKDLKKRIGRGHKQKDWNKDVPTTKYFKELLRVSKGHIIWGCNYYSKALPLFGVGRIIHFKKPTPFIASNYSHADLAATNLQKRITLFEYQWAGNVQNGIMNTANVDDLDKGLENRVHPTQKPVALYKWLLKNYAKPGDKIFDSHMGSQSSRIAAYDLGFDYWGCEKDPDYFRDGCKRFEQFKSQLKLF